ncbi:hypothetical protein FDP41_000629 [Naegleria fowleri]|uniref:BRCA1-associated protein n=1 Tax=Naegleria fowleri TaxID=5763 RepID=A0A6A5CGT2_NAEFO|nr:uncharacterized protein FDP41_000629 [Naegleria fowleri]KAF0984730.1 hypothetical protein FDP41_000629 [Naegleria fowleri]CAG4716760.1 unnamed protein product [Naegleria fowleri]
MFSIEIQIDSEVERRLLENIKHYKPYFKRVLKHIDLLRNHKTTILDTLNHHNTTYHSDQNMLSQSHQHSISDGKKKKKKNKKSTSNGNSHSLMEDPRTESQLVSSNHNLLSKEEELIEDYFTPKHVFFSSGNPSVEIITGIIKLYKHGTPRSFTNAVNDNLGLDDELYSGNGTIPEKKTNNSTTCCVNTIQTPLLNGMMDATIVDPPSVSSSLQVPSSGLHLNHSGNNTSTISSNFSSISEEEGRGEDELFYSSDELPEQRSTLVCVLAVPSFISTTDFFEFIDCFKSNILKTRILRDESPNKYMVILQFDDQKNADSFFLQYNGRPFNSLDPEDCKIVFVKSVEFTNRPSMIGKHLESTSQSTVTDIFNIGSCNDPQLHNDFHCHTNNETSNETEPEKRYELPTCPVCLDRLDSGASGIITTVCNHQFHCDCLTKWGDGNCPVCRYTDQMKTELQCAECACTSNLWVCLTCGYVGCGRYEKGHAMEHYLQTNHTYSMEADSQRVWDYTGDGYVHRLVAGNTEGKLIEISHPNQKEAIREASEMLEAQYNSKLDSFLMEYNQLLTQQLTSQRVYFESRISAIASEKDKQIESLLNELQTYRQNTQKMNNKVQKTQKKVEKEKEETDFLKELNKTLINNQKQYEIKIEKLEEAHKKIIEKKDAQIRDLQEQLHDMMMHFQTQEQIDKNPEMKNATVRAIGGEASTNPSNKTKKKK